MREALRRWFTQFFEDALAIRELVASHERLVAELKEAREDLTVIQTQVSELHTFTKREFRAVQNAVITPINKIGGR